MRQLSRLIDFYIFSEYLKYHRRKLVIRYDTVAFFFLFAETFCWTNRFFRTLLSTDTSITILIFFTLPMFTNMTNISIRVHANVVVCMYVFVKYLTTYENKTLPIKINTNDTSLPLTAILPPQSKEAGIRTLVALDDQGGESLSGPDIFFFFCF